ncbi:MAG: hypothetical protein HQK79_10210 [Desulfobacterales bacterium]|nr:hypothetical protein [Desulfobacterales bacterium]
MNFTFKLGLKLHSINTDLIPELFNLFENSIFQYIELYIIPNSYNTVLTYWKNLKIPYIIHAPHSFHGVNLAQRVKMADNSKYIKESQLFADNLDSDLIIVHGGNNGTIEQTIFQIKSFNDARIIVENKPKKGIMNEKCIGWSPSEFKYMKEEGILSGIALDFLHAACAACSEKMSVMKIINDLLTFNPKVYHLSDGNILSEKDNHCNLGKGNLSLHKFVSKISEGSMITLETPRRYDRGLEDFIDDVYYFRNMMRDLIK